MTSISSPKVSVKRQLRRQRWYSFYAMFSEQFAYDVLQRLALPESATILDPWLGSGTTTTVSSKLGYKSYGLDINPAMVVVAQARNTLRQTACDAKSLALRSKQRTEEAVDTQDPLLDWFHPVTARAIRFWNQHFADLEPQLPPGGMQFLQTSLFDSARQLAASYKSKNPTWIKQPKPDQRIRVESSEVRSVLKRCIEERLALCLDEKLCVSPMIGVASSTAIPLHNESVDAVLSSPPYCTRIDYAVTTSIELAVLGVPHQEKQSLRHLTMGTSTVRQQGGQTTAKKLAGAYEEVLDRIASHASKSSANYYAKTVRQYFSDLASSLTEIDRCTRPKSKIVLVVQDSNYKNIHIDLALITTKLAHKLEWRLNNREDFEASRNLRYVNTKSRRYQPSLRSTESVLTFCKD